MALAPEQQAALWRAKVRALARDGLGRSDGADHAAPWGAALDTDGAWAALLEVAPERAFGQALVTALRNGATSLDLMVDGEGAGAVARRAALFREPATTVWAVNGTDLAEADPAPLAVVEPMPIEPHIRGLLDVTGVLTVSDHGEVTAEYLGLEVGRVTGVGASQQFDVGVGAYDQGAFAVMHPELAPVDAFEGVLVQVREHRRRGAAPHPLNRLVRERWIRAELLADPSFVGVDSLAPVEGPVPRGGLHESAPCFALSGEGDTLVACSVGIDLDLVPAAADVAAREGATRIVLVLPARDQHAAIRDVAALAVVPIDIVTAPEPWQSPT